jgi:hypothetical protein
MTSGMHLGEAKPACASATTSQDIRPGKPPEHASAQSGGEVEAAFPELLRKKNKGRDGPPGLAAGAVPLFELSLPARPSFRADPTLALASASRIVDRILIGTSPAGAEARIRISSGLFAGAEIRVSAVAGDITVQAQLLTVSAASRQTLAVAIDRISRRLQARKLGERNPAGMNAASGVDAGGRGGSPCR